jgi:tRNA threonylcarbamoyladenosine biosynthesis protein TsaB
VILALDTSGSELLVVLLDAECRLVRGLSGEGGRHQERVMTMVDDLVAAAGGPGSLTAVAVSRGPGSQTGLRVGLATVEGIAFGRRLPIIPVPSLAVAAHRGSADGELLAAVTAGRSNVYVQRFTVDGDSRAPMGDRVRCALAELPVRLQVAPGTPIAAEASVLAAAIAAGQGAVTSPVDGPEALAAAVRQALKGAAAVAYDGLSGDYGDS